MACAREARHRSPGARRLRPPLVHQGSAEVHQDRGQPPRGAAAGDRLGRDRTPAETTETPAKQEESRSPLTDSNRRPPPYHLSCKSRDSRRSIIELSSRSEWPRQTRSLSPRPIPRGRPSSPPPKRLAVS